MFDSGEKMEWQQEGSTERVKSLGSGVDARLSRSGVGLLLVTIYEFWFLCLKNGEVKILVFGVVMSK